jgi:hypothetical protein
MSLILRKSSTQARIEGCNPGKPLCEAGLAGPAMELAAQARAHPSSPLTLGVHHPR